MRLGTCVTNPGTREPTVTASPLATLDEISGGRMDLGIGRGDSARRVLGKPPITMANTEEAIGVIRALVEGERSSTRAPSSSCPWTGRLDAAGLGRRLRPDGAGDDRPRRRRADPPARPTPTSSAGSSARSARRPRRPAAIRPRSGSRPRRRPTSGRASSGASGRAGSRRSSRNHVVDLVNRYPREQLPGQPDRLHPRPEGYDYHHHAEVGSSQRRRSSATR